MTVSVVEAQRKAAEVRNPDFDAELCHSERS